MGGVHLIVKTAQNVAHGMRVVVLYKMSMNANCGHVAFVITFQKKTAVIFKDARFKD